MRTLLFLAVTVSAALLMTCSAATPTLVPRSPVIIVVTATFGPLPTGTPTRPDSTIPITTPSADETPPPITGTPDANLKPTSVQYILAKEDVNIRSGPGTNEKIVGGIYAGQIAKVTGYMSADGKWWRVVCPVDNSENCWVSADPALTEPTTPPGEKITPTLPAGRM